MVERLYYKSENGRTVEFSVYSDLHVNVARDVDGLSDVSRKVTTAATFGQDGESYVASAMESRDIEIHGHLRATGLEQQALLRRQLNAVFGGVQGGMLTYVCGATRRQIPCYAEKCPAYSPGRWPAFTIQLVCPSPFWTEESGQETEVAAVLGGLVFDETEGLQLAETWEIGLRTTGVAVTVENPGDVACGMTVVFSAEETVTNPYLTNTATQETMKINTTLAVGEQIEVPTAYGQKDVILVQGAVRTSIFRLLAEGSTFLQLYPGENPLLCGADAGGNGLNVTVRFEPCYLGV